jgi:ring-1,2-phenylacetyl-CoA epoxidase subunit PaaB
MTIKSLDPRVTRENLPLQPNAEPLNDLHHWQTFEVFHQVKKGDKHIHVGSVHAPNAELALILAKEQFARRYKCVNLWVVKTLDINRTDYDDEDIFETNADKMYREAGGYKVMDRINKFKSEQKKI